MPTIDTARADHFSYTGSSPVSTPSIDRLAAEGMRFFHAYVNISTCTPSRSAMTSPISPESITCLIAR